MKNSNPHILILPSFYHTEREPLKGVFFRAQARALAEAGARVGVCYYDDRDTHTIDSHTLGENHFQIVEDCDPSGFPTLTMLGWSSSPRRSRLGLELWIELNKLIVRRYIRRYGRPDILHAHNILYGGYLALRLSSHFSIPFVVTEHSSQFIKAELSPREIQLTAQVLKASRGTWAVSHALGRAIENYCPTAKVGMLPNFIDTSFFDLPRAPHNDRAFHLFSLANLNANKGFETLLDAFAEAFAGDITATLTIGGGGPLRDSLRSRIMRLGIGSQVCMSGELGRDQVAEAMSHSDAFVLASRVETFGVVFVEAMAAGLPVIATDCGGPAEFITPECGTVVPVGDVQALAQAMKQIRSALPHFDTAKIKEYAHDNFDTKLLAHKLIVLYNEILTSSGADE